MDEKEDVRSRISKIKTFFATAERAPEKQLIDDHNTIVSDEQIKRMLDDLPIMVLILNSFRQIIYQNNHVSNSAEDHAFVDILGKRPGEMLGCIHSTETEGGCGTSRHCSVCGLVNTVLKSQKKQEKIITESRITAKINDTLQAFDFEVTAIPIRIKNKSFTIVYLKDISDEKRRRALERIFFHDIMNKAHGLNGYVGLVSDELKQNDRLKEPIEIIELLSHDLVSELLTQRTLFSAESGELDVQMEKKSSLAIIEESVDHIIHHPVARSKNILVNKGADDLVVETDLLLIDRILVNMLKNALEATDEGGKVSIDCQHANQSVVFSVHNTASIPEEVKLQIFQRSFSTKGTNRGLGTYSVRLLGEKYLKGRVSFESDEAQGTIFRIELPLNYV